MKTVVISEFGEVDRLEIRDVPEPSPGPGEVLLEVRAAALNHVDIWIRRGMKPNIELPWTPGSDAAGVVARLGRDVEGIVVGSEVVLNPGLEGLSPGPLLSRSGRLVEGIIGLTKPGTFARRIAVPADCLYPKPEHLSFVETAALPVDHLTAWRMVFTRAQLKPGETVLIHGIGGGVALAALQWVNLTGGRAIVTSSSDDKLVRAAEMGAAVGINYRRTEDVAAAVLAETDDRGVDVAIDSTGAATWPINFAAVRPGGRIVHCGVTTGQEVTASVQQLYWNQLSLLGSTLGNRQEFAGMLRAVETARLHPVIDSTWKLDEIRDATRRLEAGEQFGKIVLEMD
jgi:NADPH:quinone reductase-like Zn-dependent oxidoreductase